MSLKFKLHRVEQRELFSLVCIFEYMCLYSLYIHICLSHTCNNVREENCYHYFIDNLIEVQLSSLSKIIISLRSSHSKLWLFKKSHTLPSRKRNIKQILRYYMWIFAYFCLLCRDKNQTSLIYNVSIRKGLLFQSVSTKEYDRLFK